MNIFAGDGVASFHIARLSIVVFSVLSAATVVMWGLVFWLAVRRRGSLDEHASWNDPGNRVWIVLGGLAVPITAFAWIFVLGLRTMSALPMDHAQHHEHAHLRVIGHQWWWEVQYLGATPDQSFVTANEIHIPSGQPVNIELISRDVIHSFWVPRLHGKVDLVPGLDNMIQIDARQPGLYESCVLCHTIRGTEAHGTVGPDLTHFGSRRRLASDTYQTTDDVLRTWITHAQALKPNAQMPDINAFSDGEKRQLVAYLRRLN